MPTDTKISALPAASSATSTDQLAANQSGTSRRVTLAQVSAAIGSLGSGKIVQVVNVQTGSYIGGSTVIPFDDTVPQSTEGDQYMTLAITPVSATNKLMIDVVFNSMSSAAAIVALALFQDAGASAIAVSMGYASTGTINQMLLMRHYMTAGTTSPTTFKLRAGLHVGGTLYFNGYQGARMYGGALASSITITEIIP